MSGSECVKVAVRIRPMSQSEQVRGCQTVVEQAAPDNPQVLVYGGRSASDIFSYSYVFAPTTNQPQLYEVAVAPLLTKLFAGYNATILAYGQTSSGKTFTMGTDFSGQTGDNMGVIPRAIIDIFRIMNDRTDGAPCANRDTTIACSFIEVYQDNVYDLLEEKSGMDRQPIEIREAPGGDIILQGLTNVQATTKQDAFDCLLRGSTGRVVRATAMNNVSSRSHAIFTLTIQQTVHGEPNNVIRSKFHLVDLAGSERSKKTDTTGDRFKEGVEINKCLLALGNVITALGSTNGGPGKTHIPYRTSKLTRMLQDSLGGNSYTLMIACVSPADYNLSETVSTLRYANRVCKIKNKPIVNQDPQQARIKQLEATVQELRLKILMLTRDNAGSAGQDGEFRVPLPVHPALTRGLSETNLRSPRKDEHGGPHASDTGVSVQLLQENNRNLQIQLQSTLHELGSNEMRAMTAEKLIDDIEQVLNKYEANGTPETTPATESEIRREIGALLRTYKEEDFALGLHSLPTPTFRSSVTGADDDLRSEEIERKSSFHTQQQMRIHSELSQLKRQLAIKEELHRKCLDNSSVVQTLTSNRERELTEQLRDYERQIATLEEQLNELNALHETTKASEKRSKLAEERRRKVQQLESELAVLRQKSMRQAKLLKLNENDAQRIAGLSKEIQEMKATRVKLQKALRTESENFRHWRISREKEIIQLKAKDRKQQFELKKLERTYALQKSIMQRKMCETIMVNKRLKATLDRRQRNPSATDRSVMRGAEAARWIDNELELIYNTVEASVTLKLLRTQRTEQSKKLAQLRAQLVELVVAENEPGADRSIDERNQQRGELEDEIRQCETDLEYRNAQIADLHQKIHTMDTETQLATFGEGLTSLPEARESFQRLLEQLVHTHTRLFETRFQLVELQATSECQEEALGQARAQLQQAEQQYREQVVQLERTYEDKLALLLIQRTGGTGAGPAENTDGSVQPDTVHEEAIRRIDELRDELESYKQIVQMLQDKLQKHEPARRKCQLPSKLRDHLMELDYDYDEALNSSDSANSDDNLSKELLEKELDPDFRGTPLHKRKKMSSVHMSVANATNQTIKGAGYCSCAGDCGTRRCGCQRNGIACHAGCKCPPGCLNKTALVSISEHEHVSNIAIAEDASVAGPSHTKQAVDDANKENTTTLNETYLVKDERNELDILDYVAKYRKRKPFLDI